MKTILELEVIKDVHHKDKANINSCNALIFKAGDKTVA